MTEDIRHRLAEIMSAGGVGYNQISREILYMLPREFIDRYIQLWELSLGPEVNNTQDMTRDGELGRAKTQTRVKGQVPGAGSGGVSKKYRTSGFRLRSERAFELKGRIDRRLRSIARELRLELSDIEARANGGTGHRTNTAERTHAEKSTAVKTNATESTHRKRCIVCRRYGSNSWNFCPNDGHAMIRENPED